MSKYSKMTSSSCLLSFSFLHQTPHKPHTPNFKVSVQGLHIEDDTKGIYCESQVNQHPQCCAYPLSFTASLFAFEYATHWPIKYWPTQATIQCICYLSCHSLLLWPPRFFHNFRSGFCWCTICINWHNWSGIWICRVHTVSVLTMLIPLVIFLMIVSKFSVHLARQRYNRKPMLLSITCDSTTDSSTSSLACSSSTSSSTSLSNSSSNLSSTSSHPEMCKSLLFPIFN